MEGIVPVAGVATFLATAEIIRLRSSLLLAADGDDEEGGSNGGAFGQGGNVAGMERFSRAGFTAY